MFFSEFRDVIFNYNENCYGSWRNCASSVGLNHIPTIKITFLIFNGIGCYNFYLIIMIIAMGAGEIVPPRLVLTIYKLGADQLVYWDS